MMLHEQKTTVPGSNRRKSVVTEESKAYSELECTIRKTSKMWDTQGSSVDVRRHNVHLLIATEWLKNESVFIDRQEFIDAVWNGIWQRKLLWKEKKVFLYSYTENLAKGHLNCRLQIRRDELVMKGVKLKQAEKFLRWFRRLPSRFEFKQFDVTLLEPVPKFTTGMDQSMALQIFEQEGLFQNEDFIDWDQITITNYDLHEEHKKWRFREFLRGNLDILSRYFSPAQIKTQEIAAAFVDKHCILTGFNLEPARLASTHIVENLRSFDDSDYRSWIDLANKFGCPEKTLWLKKKVELRVLSMPVKIREETINTKLKTLRNFSTRAVESDKNEMTRRSVDILLTREFSEKIRPNFLRASDLKANRYDEWKSSLMTTREAMNRVAGLLYGGKSWSNAKLTIFDALVFQYIKEWEALTKEVSESKARKAIDHLRTVCCPSLKNPALTEDQILEMIEDDHASPITDSNYEVPLSMHPGHSSSFSKRFCHRKITEAEWKSMLTMIFQMDCSFIELKHDEIWEKIVNNSKVITGKPMSEIMTSFFEVILPNIADWFHKREINILSYFKTL